MPTPVSLTATVLARMRTPISQTSMLVKSTASSAVLLGQVFLSQNANVSQSTFGPTGLALVDVPLGTIGPTVPVIRMSHLL